MRKNERHILSTRPVSSKLLNEAADHNIVIDEISFIQTEAIVNEEIERKINKLSKENITAVFTSMNAVEAVSKYISTKPSWEIYCIGNTTKNLITNFFEKESIAGTAENARQLAEKILENTRIKSITFFCGDRRRDELPGKLTSNGVNVEEIVVYKTIETSKIITREYDAILFYSPSAVKSFFTKNNIPDTTRLFAIGSTTANPLKHFTQLPVIIAKTPGKENLVKLAIHHFSKSKIS